MTTLYSVPTTTVFDEAERSRVISAYDVAGARAVEQAIINGNKNVQFIEWVDHGYGIVDLLSTRAIFECWWQNKLAIDSPDLLGMQLVSFATDNPTAVPQPRW